MTDVTSPAQGRHPLLDGVRRAGERGGEVLDAVGTDHDVVLDPGLGVVHRHGGRIWAEDASLGGAAVCFTLPAADAEKAAA